MGSQAPGDWVILALPYPASALPITVNCLMKYSYIIRLLMVRTI